MFVKRYETWKDSLASIQMPNLCIQFMYRSPLILCLVSRASYNLTMQLEAVYNQVGLGCLMLLEFCEIFGICSDIKLFENGLPIIDRFLHCIALDIVGDFYFIEIDA